MQPQEQEYGLDFDAGEREKLAVKNIRSAQALLASDRKRAFATLNIIFRAGRPPLPALDGFYPGELIALDFAPGLTQFYELFAQMWKPWKGKVFYAGREAGENVIARSSLPVARISWPFYNYYIDYGPDTLRAFPFRTYLAPGRADPDRTVLKLDYNLKINPRLNVRRVLDELVQVEDGYYLGKAHLKLWWGWRQVAFFILTKG